MEKKISSIFYNPSDARSSGEEARASEK